MCGLVVDSSSSSSVTRCTLQTAPQPSEASVLCQASAARRLPPAQISRRALDWLADRKRAIVELPRPPRLGLQRRHTSTNHTTKGMRRRKNVASAAALDHSSVGSRSRSRSSSGTKGRPDVIVLIRAAAYSSSVRPPADRSGRMLLAQLTRRQVEPFVLLGRPSVRSFAAHI